MRKYFSIYNCYVIAFLIPFILLGSIFALWKVYPFGNGSILMADEFNQYIQFYNYLFDVLKGKGSLLYSWEAGMGLNFWGTFAYYLSSPISLVILLFKRAQMPEAFVLMILIKIGLSGLMMNIFLSKAFQNSKKFGTLAFSTSYAFISFSIGYFFNIMWLDCLYLLPIVILGVENLFLKKPLLFMISLTLLFISNFYMAYIVGLFTFLYFIFRSISNKYSIKKFFYHALTFLISVLIAGGISAFITLPTYLLLKNNGDQTFQWDSMFDTQFGFFDLAVKFYNSGVHLFDLPNVYCGLLAVLLAPLFFINRKIKTREKIVHFIFLISLFLSLQINGLNLMWHAFATPTGYYYRFAFVVSFLLLYLSYRSFLVFDRESIPSLFKVYIGNVFLLMLLTKLTPDLMSINKALINILLLTVFSLLLYQKATSSKSSRLFSLLFMFFICLDLGLNAYQHIKTLKSYPGYNFTRSQYNVNPVFEKMVNELNKEDKTFYRTNSTYRLTANDSLRFGYKGMTNFNTLSNGTLHQFIEEIGYSSTLGPRSLAQNQGILASDSLLGFKYLFSSQPISKFGYDKIKCENGICLYKNDYALPIGFMVDKNQFNFNLKEDNPFEKQNLLLGPVNKTVNYFQELKASSIAYHNLEVNTVGNIEYVKKIDPQQEGSIEMTFDVQGQKQFYTLLAAGKGFAGFNETTVYVNGKSLGVYPTYHNERALELGAFSNEKVDVKIVFSVPQTQLAQQLFYALDIPSFASRINDLRKEQLDVSNWTETSINGEINVVEPGALFLSIPFDKGWKVKVDGKSEPLIKLGGFIGVDLDKGKHDIDLTFLPDGFKTGCVISIASLLLLFIYILFLFKSRKNKAGEGK